MKSFEEILKLKVRHVMTMTDYQNILDAQKEYESQFRQAAVSGMVCQHPNDKRVNWHYSAILCSECNCIIEQFGEPIDPPHKLC